MQFTNKNENAFYLQNNLFGTMKLVIKIIHLALIYLEMSYDISKHKVHLNDLFDDLEPNNLKHLNFLRYGYSILLLVKIYDLMLYYQKVQAVK